MYRNILVPYDGSEPANKALTAAIELGVDPKPVTITALLVTDATDTEKASYKVALHMAGFTVDEIEKMDVLSASNSDAARSQARERVSKFFEGLPKNIDVKIEVKRGDPRDAVCRFAEENDIDCIIMGRRGRSGIRAALGSVSTAVLRRTDLPVMVVR